MGLTCMLVGHDWDVSKVTLELEKPIICTRCSYVFQYNGKRYHIGQKGFSNGYTVMILGFLGIVGAGIAYVLADQVTMGYVMDFAVANHLDPDLLSIWTWLFSALTLAILASFLIGAVVQAHISRNEG